MLTLKPFQFTPENLALIPTYRSKWQKIAYSTESLDREKASIAINQAYEFLGLANPSIIFFDEPYDALSFIRREIDAHWGQLNRSSLGNAIASQLLDKLLATSRNADSDSVMERLGGNLDEGRAKSIAAGIAASLDPSFTITLMIAHMTSILNLSLEADSGFDGISKTAVKSFMDFISVTTFLQSTYLLPIQWQIFDRFIDLFFKEQSPQIRDSWKEIGADIIAGRVNRKQGGEYLLPTIQLNATITNVFIPSVMADYGHYINYCHEVLGFDRNYLKWSIFYELITNCGWFYPYEKTVLMCPKGLASASDRI